MSLLKEKAEAETASVRLKNHPKFLFLTSVCGLNIRGKETMMKGSCLLCCWMFAIFRQKKGHVQTAEQEAQVQ